MITPFMKGRFQRYGLTTTLEVYGRDVELILNSFSLSLSVRNISLMLRLLLTKSSQIDCVFFYPPKKYRWQERSIVVYVWKLAFCHKKILNSNETGLSSFREQHFLVDNINTNEMESNVYGGETLQWILNVDLWNIISFENGKWHFYFGIYFFLDVVVVVVVDVNISNSGEEFFFPSFFFFLSTHPPISA